MNPNRKNVITEYAKQQAATNKYQEVVSQDGSNQQDNSHLSI